MTRFSCLVFMSIAFSVCAQAEKPRNIIMVIGDGLGPAYTTAYRNFVDDKSSEKIDATVFDRHLTGMASTYPARVSGYITDSAASATALSTGFKSYNGAIGVDVNKQSQQTVLEWAKSQGLKTGIAVTSQINHATPASFAAHNESRINYNAIADSYFDVKLEGKFVLDVMLGGGWQFYIREDRNLVDEFKSAGYQYVDDMQQLADLKPQQPVLGLFADEGMPWALDSDGKTRLPILVEAAVKQLSNEKGYFLLVEASQIDWAGHNNDISSVMAETHDLALTLAWLESYVESNPDTLVVVTADHSTGGFSLATDGDYRWDPEPLKGLKASLPTIAGKVTESISPINTAESWLGLIFSDAEKDQLSLLNLGDKAAVYEALAHILDKRSNTGWTTSGHTGVDVQVFAMGQGAELFTGNMDNTDIAKKLFSLMGKN